MPAKQANCERCHKPGELTEKLWKTGPRGNRRYKVCRKCAAEIESANRSTKPIGTILEHMTIRSLQTAAEQNDRERQAAERLAAIRRQEARAAEYARMNDPRRAPNTDGRYPEYKTVYHARRKAERYERHLSWAEKERDFLARKAVETLAGIGAIMINPNPHPKDILPLVGICHLIQDVLLPTGLHRMQWEQRGTVPDAAELREKYAPTDRPVEIFAWLDEATNRGYVYMAWKEWRQDELFGQGGGQAGQSKPISN